MATTLLRGMTGASRRASSSSMRSPVNTMSWYSGSPCTAASTSHPGSPSTTAYAGSSPVVYLAMRTASSSQRGDSHSQGDARDNGGTVMTQDVGVRGTWGAFFAATLMVIVGTLGSLQGIAGIANGSFYVEPKDYWYTTSAA